MTFFKKLKTLFSNEDEGFGLLFQSKSLKSDENSWTKANYINAYKSSLYVNKAIEKRATKVGEIEFRLTKDGDDVPEKQDKNKIIKLLSKPNKLQTGKQFFALWQKYYDIFGEAFILKLKDSEFLSRKGISELYLLNPRYVTKKFNDVGELTDIEYKKPNGSPITYKAEEIIYDNNPDPDDPRNGMSLLKAGAKSISIADQLDAYQNSILRNGGKIDGVFNFKNIPNVSKQQRDELKKDYKEMYSESHKSGMPLFLGGDADYKRMGASPEELSYIESKKMTLNDICILTEVPKMLLASSDDIQYNNADTSLRIFLREVIKPLQEQKASVLNEDRDLVPEDQELEIIDPTPDDIELKTKIIDNGIKNYYMTINEARELMDLEPVKDGDEILAPFSVSPLSSVDEPNTPVPSPPPTDNEPKKGLKQGREVVKTINHPLKSYDFRREYHKQFIKKADAYEKKFLIKLKSYLRGQRDRMLENIDDGRIRGLKKKNLIDEIFNLRIEIEIGVKELLPLLKSITRQSGEDAMKLIGSGGFKMNSNIESWLDLKANVFMRQINETTFEKLKSQFSESVSIGEDRGQLIKRIKETYGDISKGRANVIARTEVHGITQEGTIEGYKQAEMPIKIWVAVLDSSTREWHADLDGEEVPINYPFSNGLQFPGDPSGDASEVVNCRCSV